MHRCEEAIIVTGEGAQQRVEGCSTKGSGSSTSRVSATSAMQARSTGERAPSLVRAKETMRWRMA